MQLVKIASITNLFGISFFFGWGFSRFGNYSWYGKGISWVSINTRVYKKRSGSNRSSSYRGSSYRGGNFRLVKYITISMKSKLEINCGIGLSSGFCLSLTQVMTISVGMSIVSISVGISIVSSIRKSIVSFIVKCISIGIGLRLCHNCGNSESYEQLKFKKQ